MTASLDRDRRAHSPVATLSTDATAVQAREDALELESRPSRDLALALSFNLAVSDAALNAHRDTTTEGCRLRHPTPETIC